MDTGGWRKACSELELKEGRPILVTLDEEEVFLVRLEGRAYAVGNKCPHYECHLHEGALLGREIVCKCHDARFDVTTGRMLSPPSLKDLSVYPVRLEGGELWVGPAEKARSPKVVGSDPRSFLIVGGGAAGNAAAETLRREGFAGRIVMVSAELDLPYDRPNLSKEFLAGAAKPEWMPLRGPKFYEGQRIETMTGAKVVSLDPKGKTVLLESGEKLGFDKVLLATGGTARGSSLPGAEGEDCFTLRSFADARSIAAAASGAARVLLIGAGFIGLELAGAFRERGLEVDVAAPEKLPLARVLGDRVGTFLTRLHEGKGVVFHLGSRLRKISGPLGAKIATLADGTELRADFLVFGLGARPAVEYLTGTGLLREGAVPVNARLETAYPDVLAAGDIAAVSPASGGEGVRFEHWVVAERQGQHAARSMLGSKASYEEVPFFWTRQAGIGLHYAGFAREWDEVAVRGEVESGKFLAGYYKGGALLAASSVGMSTELIAVESMLRRGIALPAGRLADGNVDLLELARA